MRSVAFSRSFPKRPPLLSLWAFLELAIFVCSSGRKEGVGLSAHWVVCSGVSHDAVCSLVLPPLQPPQLPCAHACVRD